MHNSLPHTHTHTLRVLSLSLTHMHTHTHTCMHTHTHAQFSLYLSCTHTHTQFSLSPLHTCTHTHTLAHSQNSSQAVHSRSHRKCRHFEALMIRCVYFFGMNRFTTQKIQEATNHCVPMHEQMKYVNLFSFRLLVDDLSAKLVGLLHSVVRTSAGLTQNYNE